MNVKTFKNFSIKRTMDIDDVIVCQHQEQLILLPSVLKLPRKYKNVLYLHYYEGYKTFEIAENVKYE